MSLKQFSFLGSLPMMISAVIPFASFGVELKIFVQDLKWILQGKRNPKTYPIEDIWILLTCSQSSFPVFIQPWLLPMTILSVYKTHCGCCRHFQ